MISSVANFSAVRPRTYIPTVRPAQAEKASVGEGAVAGAAIGAGVGAIGGAVAGGLGAIGLAGYEGAKIGAAHGPAGVALGLVGGVLVGAVEERYLGIGTKVGSLVGFGAGTIVGGAVGAIVGLFT